MILKWSNNIFNIYVDIFLIMPLVPSKNPPKNKMTDEEFDRWFHEELKRIGKEDHDFLVKLSKRGK